MVEIALAHVADLIICWKRPSSNGQKECGLPLYNLLPVRESSCSGSIALFRSTQALSSKQYHLPDALEHLLQHASCLVNDHAVTRSLFR